jgi:WD40 repeat protein/class 3 adenylate cyclase
VSLDLASGEAHDAQVATVETGIKTFLIADVRGYTRFTQERGDEAAAHLATRFAELAREAIEAAGGSLVELRGDEALAVFDSARQALRAAAGLQEHFVAETVADPSLPLAVGIGLDAGEAVPVDGGYRGGALNLAARLCSLAGPGEVLISPGVAHLARKVEGLDYVERGPVRLKGLEKPVDVVAVRPERDDVARDLAFRRALDPALAGAVETRNPYKGLRAFAEDDAEDFFGREVLAEHLVERLGQMRFLAVVGPSGSGKSSVVRAGLVPRLRKGALPGSERWTVIEMLPGAYPLEELEAALLRGADSAPVGLLEQLEQDERGLLRAAKRLIVGEESELLLVVDQLEEVFTLVEDEARRTQFLALLERAVSDPHARLRVVVTLRADFYDRPLLYSGFAELLRDYVEALVPLKPDEFERAIAGPAERVGARFEPGLLAELVTDVSDEPGALPLLQYALTELYERREGSTLTAAAYREIGGISGALAGRAEEIHGGLGEHAQEAARQLFLRLVTLGEGAEDTRRRVERTELASMEVDQDALEQAIQEFGAWRLLSFDRDPRSGTPTIEVAHEALMREWGRFRRWIDSGREQVRLHRRLATAAREWEAADREASYLLRGSNLVQFELLAGESTIALTELEREFVEASTAANELELARQRRQNRRLRTLLAGAVGLLVLAIIAGAIALVSRSNAQHEAKVALGRQLGAEAVSEPRIDIAMLLARESLNLDRSPQTEGTLLATLLREPAVTGTFTVPIRDRPQEVKVAPDGKTIAAVMNNNVMRIYSVRTHQQTAEFSAANFDYAYVPTSGDLVIGQPAGTAAQLVDPKHGNKPLRTFTLSGLWQHNPTINGPLLVTRDGRYLLFPWSLITPDNGLGPLYVEKWPLDQGGKSQLVRLSGKGLIAAAVLRGDRVIVATNGQIVSWDAKTGKEGTVPGPTFAPNDVSAGAISPDGRLLAYGLVDGSVHFFDITHNKGITALGAHSARVQRIAFSPDSKLAVSTGDDGLAIIWNPRSGQPIERLTGHTGRVLGPDFSPDGKTLYTAGLDGTILQYDLGGTRRFGSPFGLGQSSQPASPLTALPHTPLLAISPNSRIFAASAVIDPNGNAASPVELYSVSPLRRVGTIPLPKGRSAGAGAFAGNRFVVGADRGLVEFWPVTDGHARPGPLLHGFSAKSQVRALVTADAGRIVAGVDGWYGPPPTERGELAIWRDGRLVRGKAIKLSGFGNAVALSADGLTAAVTADALPGHPVQVLIVDTRTGKVERAITVPHASGRATALAFGPDGTLATGSWSGIVNLWDPKTGAGIGRPTLVAPAPVSSISFSRDGKTFATSGGSSGGTSIWETATRQQLGSNFPGGEGQWGNVAYTSDGRYLMSVFSDGTAFRWPVAVDAWENQACSVAGRNFTSEEWRRFVGSRRYSKVCPQYHVPEG